MPSRVLFIRFLKTKSNFVFRILDKLKILTPDFKSYLIKQMKRIVVSGNIGAGKTTLCRLLNEFYPGSLLIEEKFDFGNLLPNYYHDFEVAKSENRTSNRFALPLQLAFLNTRFENEVKASRSKDINVIQDRCLLEDRFVFAEVQRKNGALTPSDFQFYLQTFQEKLNQITFPSHLIYLQTSVEALDFRIKKRARNFESTIDKGYLAALNVEYDSFFGNLNEMAPSIKTFKINTTEINQKEVFDTVVKALE